MKIGTKQVNYNVQKLNVKPIWLSLLAIVFFNIGVFQVCCCAAPEVSKGEPVFFTSVDELDEHPEYNLILKVADGKLVAESETELEILVQFGAAYGRGKVPGNPVKNLQTIFGRIIEVFIVSEDFEHFVHTRPEDFGEITADIKQSGVFKIRYNFPSPGGYRAVVCFSHKGQEIYKHFNIMVAGAGSTDDRDKDGKQLDTAGTGSDVQSGSFDGYDVFLNIGPAPVATRRKSKLVYHIRDENGNDVEDLDVFMGTELHLITWRSDFNFFGYERTKPPEGKPGTVLIVPPIKTAIKYGTGILREIKKNGKMLIEHGKVEGLLPVGKFPFKVKDKEARIKVEVGDWVEFWVDNNETEGIVITRIEPLATMPSSGQEGVYKWAGNLPVYPGPSVPIEHVFPAAGRYALFAQFENKGKIVTTKFFVDVKDVASLKSPVVVMGSESDADKGLVKLTQGEKNGQLIYRTSRSPSGGKIYIKQDDGSKMDASETGITCVGCHGEDGRGGQEGGVLTSDIRYVYLTKPYGVTHISGRKHPPYTDPLLKKAISDGIDPGNNKLDPTMVRWEMSDTDLNDLCAYIHRLSEMGKPGVTDEYIRIGCILDVSGPLASTGKDAMKMIEGAFKNINNGGKIYGRSLKLVVGDGGNDPARSLEAAKTLVEEENIFCMIGNLGEAATNSVIPYLEEKGIPIVAPLAPTYQPDSVVEQNAFFLFPTVAYQTRVMVDYIIRTRKDRKSKPKVAVISSNDKFGKSGLKAAAKQLKLYGNRSVVNIEYEYSNLDVKSIAATLAESGAENVLILTPDARVFGVVSEADQLGLSLRYFCNNMLLIRNILNIPKASERFLLAQNFSFAGKDNPSCAEFLEIIKGLELSSKNIMLQMAAFTGVKLLEEGLRLAGRDLTRKSAISGLEEIQFNTGIFGVISYKPGNHTGDTGVFLVRPDEASGNFVPVSKWMRPTESGIMF